MLASIVVSDDVHVCTMTTMAIGEGVAKITSKEHLQHSVWAYHHASLVSDLSKKLMLTLLARVMTIVYGDHQVLAYNASWSEMEHCVF